MGSATVAITTSRVAVTMLHGSKRIESVSLSIYRERGPAVKASLLAPELLRRECSFEPRRSQ